MPDQINIDAAPPAARGVLSPRQWEIAERLSRGEDTTEIAATMRVSERTVKAVVQGLNAKFETRNRPHLIAHMFRKKLLR